MALELELEEKPLRRFAFALAICLTAGPHMAPPRAFLARATAAPASRVPEARSLSGEPLFAPEIEPDRRATLEAELAEARANYERDPRSEANIIWYGRRLAYLSRYREAIEVYTRGLALYPESHKLLRHRGHRYITLRRFDAAIADLRRATELIAGVPDAIEPDGQPNRLNLPRSTSHSNIWYHLGLAHYLEGDFTAALEAYRQCLAFSSNDDMLCATSHWLYMTLRRLGRREEADAVLRPIRADMQIIENTEYHELLLLYKGERTVDEVYPAGHGSTAAADTPAAGMLPAGTPAADRRPDSTQAGSRGAGGTGGSGEPGDSTRAGGGPAGETRAASALQSATLGYGVGNWHLYNGRPEAAREIFARVVRGPAWAAFGHIAAEAELVRVRAAAGK